MKLNRYAAVVLAAGFSQRMGKFKSLLPLGKATITDHLINTFLENHVDVYLVVGYRRNQLRASISTGKIRIVENLNYRQGMFSSIQTGICSLEISYRAAFIAPVDIPLVDTSTLGRLLQAAEEQPGKIIHPTYKKSRGHPPLIPAIMFRTIIETNRNSTLKTVLNMHKDLEIEVEVPDTNILFDIDEPSDYVELLERYKSIISSQEGLDR